MPNDGTPAAAAAPAPTSSDATPAATSGSFADLALDTDLADDLGGEVDAPAAAATPPAKAEPAPAAPAAAPAPAAVVPPATDAAPAPAPGKSDQPPAAPAASPATPPAQPTAEDMAKLRGEALTQIASQYAISEEQTRQLMTEPEKVLPQLLAEAQLRAQEVTFRMVMAQLPAALERITAYNTASSAAEAKFFTAHPELKEHKATVEKLVLAYRNMYPDATMDEVIADVGDMAKKRLKIAVAPPAATPPAAPAVRRPPGAAAAPAAPPKAPEVNAFGSLALLDEDALPDT